MPGLVTSYVLSSWSREGEDNGQQQAPKPTTPSSDPHFVPEVCTDTSGAPVPDQVTQYGESSCVQVDSASLKLQFAARQATRPQNAAKHVLPVNIQSHPQFAAWLDRRRWQTNDCGSRDRVCARCLSLAHDVRGHGPARHSGLHLVH